MIVRDRVRLLALLGGLDHREESLLGLVVPIEQQGRAPDPGRAIIDAPERDGGEVLLVFEEDRENFGALFRDFLLGSAAAAEVPEDTCGVAAITPAVRATRLTNPGRCSKRCMACSSSRSLLQCHKLALDQRQKPLRSPHIARLLAGASVVRMQRKKFLRSSDQIERRDAARVNYACP